MTKKEMFVALSEIPGVAENQEMVDFLNHEIALLDKRNSSRSNKPTKAQLEKNAQRDTILVFLADRENATCGEVAEAIGVTLHSATGLLTTLRKSGQVKREYVGKTPVYSLGSELEA